MTPKKGASGRAKAKVATRDGHRNKEKISKLRLLNPEITGFLGSV